MSDNTQPQLFNIPINHKDVEYTDRMIAKLIIHKVDPTGIILDPCKGGGALSLTTFQKTSADSIAKYQKGLTSCLGMIGAIGS